MRTRRHSAGTIAFARCRLYRIQVVKAYDEQQSGAQILVTQSILAVDRYLLRFVAIPSRIQFFKAPRLFSPVYCDLRYCPRCGGRQFARLIEKYLPIVRAIISQKRPGHRLRLITLTSRNTGTLTPEQIKRLNLDAKKTLKRLLPKDSSSGALWCDEVGYENTNLHAHVLLYGPYIAQDDLARVWNEVSGNQVVHIRDASGGGWKELLYMLKYVSKPPGKDPKFIGSLEVAFHGVRRVHAIGVFYNFSGGLSHFQRPGQCRDRPNGRNRHQPFHSL
jgi:hypothetical protein